MLLLGLYGTLSDYYQADVHSAKKACKNAPSGAFFVSKCPITYPKSLCSTAKIALADRHAVGGGGSQQGSVDLGIGSD